MTQARNHAIRMNGVPQFSNHIAEALKLRTELTPEEEVQADAQIARATDELRKRQIESLKRAPQPEESDDATEDI
jgi:hypothetical protein